MPSRWKISASSLMSAMLTSRWMFSMTFADSATRMLDARWVPAGMMLAYSVSTNAAAAGVDPEVTYTIVSRRCSRSPGLIRSGL